MKTSQLWLISGVAALIAIIIGIAAAIGNAAAPEDPEASPTPTPSATATPTATPTTTPRPTPTSTPPPVATCENTVTDDFLAMMAAQGWRAENTVGQPIGPQPFDDFLDGTPEGAVVCRWAADPDAATDNVVDLAWAIIAAEAVGDAIQRFSEQGYVVSGSPEGTYLVNPDGGAYLFTSTDTRWAATQAELAFIKAPSEAG